MSDLMIDNEPCDCLEANCEECNKRLLEQKEDEEMNEHYRDLQDQENRDFQRELEGGDEDDNDEEDMHGSRPINEPDEEE